MAYPVNSKCTTSPRFLKRMYSGENKKKALFFTLQKLRARFLQTVARLSIFELFMILILYDWMTMAVKNGPFAQTKLMKKNIFGL